MARGRFLRGKQLFLQFSYQYAIVFCDFYNAPYGLFRIIMWYIKKKKYFSSLTKREIIDLVYIYNGQLVNM